MKNTLLTIVLLYLVPALSDSNSRPQVTVQPPVSSDQRMPVRVTIDELVLSTGLYHDQLVELNALLKHGDLQDQQNDIFRLEDEKLRSIRVAFPQGQGQLRFLVGQHVKVIGVFWDLTMLAMKIERCWTPTDRRVSLYPAGLVRCDLRLGNHQYFVGAQFVDTLESELLEEDPEPAPEIPEPEPELPPEALVDLRELVDHPEDYVDQRIGVIGKYRGNNLYRDLPFTTKKTPRDFIIKVAGAAIWVTGKRAPGLDADKRRDTGKWVKVIGTVWMDETDVYVKSEWIGIVAKPDDPGMEPLDAEEKSEPIPHGPPPEILFVIPLDGEKEIPLDSEFMIQFSKDMDPECFAGNVELSYSDATDSDPLPTPELRYDSMKRTLVVRPKTRLLPQRTIRLVLRRGIQDEDGIPLQGRIVSRRVAMNLGGDSALVVFTFTTQVEDHEKASDTH